MSRAVTSKVCIFDPTLVKPKWVWDAVVFFNFQKFCLHFSAVCLQFFKKNTTSQTHFGFTNMGSNMLTLEVTALDIYFFFNRITLY